MVQKGWNVGVCLVVAALAACGGNNEENNGKNNGATNNGSTTGTNNGATNNGATNNGATNNGATNNGANNGANQADVMEIEPNGFDDNWTPFNLGETIGGTIATGAGESSDIDVFSVTLTAGTVIEFGFDSTGPGLSDTATVLLEDENQNITRVAAVSQGPAKRQAFIPVDGTYIVAVYDERAADDAAPENGGTDSWYVVSLEEVTVTPTDIALPSNTQGDQSDGTIQMYNVTPTADAAVVAEITADREPITSTLDSVVFVLDAAGEIVGFDDDGADAESYDSRAIFAATGGETYTVVVDSWYGTNTGQYLIDLSETDDDISAPNELAVGTPATGVIDALPADFDTDYFTITLQPGETVRIEAVGAGGLEPAVTAVVDTGFFGLIPFANGFEVGGTAAIEFAHPSDATDPGEYYILVDDVRNIESETPANAGDAAYTYTLNATQTSWSATDVTLPYTTAGSIPNVGNYVWYSFTIPAGHMFAATATSTNADFEAGIATLTEGGTASVELGSASLFPAAETTVTMGVRDYFFRGGAGWDFTPNFQSFDITAITFTAVAEVEPNDSTADAQAITAPAGVTGELDGMGDADLRPDWFAVMATAGQTIGAITEGGLIGDDMDDADTIVTIYAPDGTVVAENDDYDGQDTSFFSAVTATAATAGVYHVVVTPYCGEPDTCSGNGDYTLNVFVQ